MPAVYHRGSLVAHIQYCPGRLLVVLLLSFMYLYNTRLVVIMLLIHLSP